MAITTTEVYGRWRIKLTRDEEVSERTLTIPNPVSDENAIQTAVNQLNTRLEGGNATVIQPSNWRDSNVDEEVWTCSEPSFEIVSVSTTPYTPTN